MNIGIDLDQAIHALADASDLVGVDEMLHGKRVGLMAQQCRGLSLGEPELENLFHIGLLHDCAGIVTTMYGGDQRSGLGRRGISLPPGQLSYWVSFHHLAHGARSSNITIATGTSCASRIYRNPPFSRPT